MYLTLSMVPSASMLPYSTYSSECCKHHTKRVMHFQLFFSSSHTLTVASRYFYRVSVDTLIVSGQLSNNRSFLNASHDSAVSDYYQATEPLILRPIIRLVSLEEKSRYTPPPSQCPSIRVETIAPQT